MLRVEPCRAPPMPAAQALSEDLTDAVYRAALEPQAWDEVMQAMRSAFPSQAQTFYLLHMQPHRIQPISLSGIESRWVRNFDELYFAADNPWIRMTRQLHRPGIVRTNERLDRVLRRRGALYRSAYYNDWMKPQGFRYTIGNTLLSEGGIVANITLMRAPELKTLQRCRGARLRGLEPAHDTRAADVDTAGLQRILRRAHRGAGRTAAARGHRRCAAPAAACQCRDGSAAAPRARPAAAPGASAGRADRGTGAAGRVHRGTGGGRRPAPALRRKRLPEPEAAAAAWPDGPFADGTTHRAAAGQRRSRRAAGAGLRADARRKPAGPSAGAGPAACARPRRRWASPTAPRAPT